jgi:hypothetical protein
VDHADELRDSTRDERVHRLHPPAEELSQLYATGRARFTAGLARINAAPTADPAQEPVTSLAARYEAALDLTLAAAEVGLRPAELTARIARSRSARRDLAALTVTGGTIKRDAWVVAFPRIVAALGLGVTFTPATNGEREAVWIDRDRNTWITVGLVGDRAAAERACFARGAALPKTSELVAAAGQGLASATRVSTPVWTREQRLDLSNQRYSLVVDLAAATTTRVSPTTRHAAVCIQRRLEVRP